MQEPGIKKINKKGKERALKKVHKIVQIVQYLEIGNI